MQIDFFRVLNVLPQTSFQENIVALIAALFAFITVYIVGNSFSAKPFVSQRIKSLQNRRAELKDRLKDPKKRDKRQYNVESMKAWVKRLNLLQESQAQKYKEMLIAAGYREKDTIYKLAIIKAIAPFVLGFIAIVLLEVNILNPVEESGNLFWVILAMYLGFKLPDIMVINQRNKRWGKVRKALPDALDLMMVCAEAGLTLTASLERVSKELGLAYPELAEELSLTSIEMGFLPERRAALDNLQKRVNIPEVRGIASVLVQTEKYGTPVSQALRTLAAEYRTQRIIRAEQKAARLPAIMTVPMILFILPTLFIVIITPAVIQLMGVEK